jgi:NADH-quinone oxidoreductase subunit H
MFDFLTPQIIASVILVFVVVHVILGACAYLIMLERKLSAWMQDRIGPNRVGPMGLLQPIADGVKFLMKEDFDPRGVDKFLFILAPGIITVIALIGFAVIPWGGVLDFAVVAQQLESIGFARLLPTEVIQWMKSSGTTVHIAGATVNIGVVYLLAVASLGVYGVALGGWASNSKYSFLGGMRASAQMISYEIPMGLALLAVILTCGTIDPNEFVRSQIEGMWYLFQQPVAAVLFYACMLAESNRAPFDLAEAESELIGGYHTEYSSMKFALFFLAEYAHMITGSAFFAVLFLGGWSVNPLPWGPDLAERGGLLLILAQIGVMAGKIFLLISLSMAIRWTLPRFRFDQLMRLAWEGMIPTALLVVLVSSFMVYMGWTEYMWAGSIGTIVLIYVIHPLMPRQANPNHKVPMIGSRFFPVRDREAFTSPRDPLALADAPGGDSLRGGR